MEPDRGGTQRTENKTMQTLADIQAAWRPTLQACQTINERLIEATNADPLLSAMRDFVERTAYGMGERSFYAMWKAIFRELPPNPVCLEIGVHRGQTLALWRAVSESAKIFGLSPYNGIEVGEERDYREDVRTLFNQFHLMPYPSMIKGMSDDAKVIAKAQKTFNAGLDVLYIDGGHSYETTKSDILNYAPLVKVGGFLVIDDCACCFPHPFGYFAGIGSVCNAVDAILPPHGNSELCQRFEHLFAVVHNRVWRRML